MKATFRTITTIRREFKNLADTSRFNLQKSSSHRHSISSFQLPEYSDTVASFRQLCPQHPPSLDLIPSRKLLEAVLHLSTLENSYKHRRHNIRQSTKLALYKFLFNYLDTCLILSTAFPTRAREARKVKVAHDCLLAVHKGGRWTQGVGGSC